MTRIETAREILGTARLDAPAERLARALRRRLIGNDGGERVEATPLFGGVAAVRLEATISVWAQTRSAPLAEARPEDPTEPSEEAARAALERAGAAAIQAADFGSALERALTADPWLALDAASAPTTLRTLAERRAARVFCRACAGAGRIPVEETGELHPCAACDGQGATGALWSVDLKLRSALMISVSGLEASDAEAPPLGHDAELDAEATLRAALAELVARRGFAPRLARMASSGQTRVARFEASTPIARCRVSIGRRSPIRVHEIRAAGAPLQFVDPPALLDELHQRAFDRLLSRSGGEFAAPSDRMADQLARSRVGRAALRAAAAFEPRFTAEDIAFSDATAAETTGPEAGELDSSGLMTAELPERLFAFAKVSYRRLGHGARRWLWRLTTLCAPALALTLAALGYVGLVDRAVADPETWTGAALAWAAPDARESAATIGWALPFALLWLGALQLSMAHYRLRTRWVLGRRLGLSVGDALRLGHHPWTALVLGGLLYGLAFLGAAPRGQDRLGQVEETQLVARFQAPFLNDLFDGAAEARDRIALGLGLSPPAETRRPIGMDQRVVMRAGPLANRLRTVGFGARQGQWRLLESIAVVKTLGPSGEAALAVACAPGGAVFALMMEAPPAVSRVSLFVNRISLPDAVVESRAGAVVWPASDGAIAAARRGVALRAVVTPLQEGAAPGIYDFSLEGSAAAIGSAVAGCPR